MDFDFLEETPTGKRGMDSRIMALEIEAIAARRDLATQITATEKRVDRLEAIGARIVWAIAGATLGVVLTVASAALYVGGRLEKIDSLERAVDHLGQRIEHLERSAMGVRRD